MPVSESHADPAGRKCLPVVPGIVPSCDVIEGSLTCSLPTAFDERDRLPEVVPQSSIVGGIWKMVVRSRTLPANKSKARTSVGVNVDIKLAKEELTKREETDIDISTVATNIYQR